MKLPIFCGCVLVRVYRWGTYNLRNLQTLFFVIIEKSMNFQVYYYLKNYIN